MFAKVEKSTEGTTISQGHSDTVSVAIRLKSMGLTDEAIECAIGVPKTTLRRWVEKAGHKWKVGEIDVPYRFKALRGNDLPEVE